MEYSHCSRDGSPSGCSRSQDCSNAKVGPCAEYISSHLWAMACKCGSSLTLGLIKSHSFRKCTRSRPVKCGTISPTCGMRWSAQLCWCCGVSMSCGPGHTISSSGVGQSSCHCVGLGSQTGAGAFNGACRRTHRGEVVSSLGAAWFPVCPPVLWRSLTDFGGRRRRRFCGRFCSVVDTCGRSWV